MTEEIGGEEFIRKLIGEVIDQCGNEADVPSPPSDSPDIETNFQCGECGLMFENNADVEDHIKIVHVMEEPNCLFCETYKKEEEKLKNIVNEKDNLIAMLKEQNSNLTKKNVSMEREIRRNELALTECLFEKAEIKKDNQREK